VTTGGRSFMHFFGTLTFRSIRCCRGPDRLPSGRSLECLDLPTRCRRDRQVPRDRRRPEERLDSRRQASSVHGVRLPRPTPSTRNRSEGRRNGARCGSRGHDKGRRISIPPTRPATDPSSALVVVGNVGGEPRDGTRTGAALGSDPGRPCLARRLPGKSETSGMAPQGGWVAAPGNEATCREGVVHSRPQASLV
jgi:hypothetical protein